MKTKQTKLAYIKKWKEEHPDQVAAQQVRWREKHPTYLKEWRKDNRAKVKQYKRNERLKKKLC